MESFYILNKLNLHSPVSVNTDPYLEQFFILKRDLKSLPE